MSLQDILGAETQAEMVDQGVTDDLVAEAAAKILASRLRVDLHYRDGSKESLEALPASSVEEGCFSGVLVDDDGNVRQVYVPLGTLERVEVFADEKLEHFARKAVEESNRSANPLQEMVAALRRQAEQQGHAKGCQDPDCPVHGGGSVTGE